MSKSLRVRYPKKLNLEDVGIYANDNHGKKRHKKQKTRQQKKTNNSHLESYPDIPLDDVDIGMNSNKDVANNSENHRENEVENTIFIDCATTYASELEKIQGIIPIPESYTSFIMPDFNRDKRILMFSKFALVKRRKVFLECADESECWLYSCSCDPVKKGFIESLPEIISEEIKPDDYCIHVSVVQFVMSCNSDLEGVNEDISKTSSSTVLQIPYCKGRFVIVAEDGSAGVIEKQKCLVCHSNMCKHADAAKEIQDDVFESGIMDDDDDDFQTSFDTDEKLYSCNPINFYLTEKEKTAINKPPELRFKKIVSQGEDVLCVISEFGECCANCGTDFNYGLNRPFKKKHLLLQRNIYTCFVYDLVCPGCELVYMYEGRDDCLLHYGDFLIHHTVLRDYMYHFLHGNSCSLHGFYDVWTKHQEDNNNNFRMLFRYDSWRKAWYGYLSLVLAKIDTDNFECDACGPEPTTVVCDATSLGFQRKYLTFRKNDGGNEIVPRMSVQKDRIVIPCKSTRGIIKSVCSRKMSKSDAAKVISSLESFPEIREVFLWTLESFPVVIPVELRRFFIDLAQTTPACALIPPTEFHFELAEKMFDENIKGNISYMKNLHTFLPTFHKLLTCIFERSLPKVWRPLIQKLICLSVQPFNDSHVLSEIPSGSEDPFEFFPSLPTKRGRGRYQLDNETTDTVCNKSYPGHPNLTPGIFTLFCPHGINYGFQIMRNVESTNTPFKLFKTRFQKGPKFIIYDNACNLHDYSLNRDPWFFRNTTFLVDRFHWPNHRGCSMAYNISMYPDLKDVNSQINEQQNAAVKKLKSQLSYMTPQNFTNHCKFFMWYRNELKKKKLS